VPSSHGGNEARKVKQQLSLYRIVRSGDNRRVPGVAGLYENAELLRLAREGSLDGAHGPKSDDDCRNHAGRHRNENCAVHHYLRRAEVLQDEPKGYLAAGRCVKVTTPNSRLVVDLVTCLPLTVTIIPSSAVSAARFCRATRNPAPVSSVNRAGTVPSTLLGSVPSSLSTPPKRVPDVPKTSTTTIAEGVARG
jgi:hypothetical protein